MEKGIKCYNNPKDGINTPSLKKGFVGTLGCLIHITNPKMMEKINYAIILILVLSGLSIPQSINAQNGQIIEGSLLVNDLQRDYVVYTPASYDGSEAWPLVLNLHATGFNAYTQMALSLMNPVADTAHFIVVYPNGSISASNPNSNDRFWNPLLLPNREDDIPFLDHLIDSLIHEFNVDKSKVYMTGGDQGALMTYTFACQMPEKIAAIATVSNVLPDNFSVSSCVPSIPLPLLHMHGTADPLAPFEGGIDGRGNFAPAPREVIGEWMQNNGCTLDSSIVFFPDITPSDNSTVSSVAFSSCTSYLNTNQEIRPYEVWFYIIENGGHNYPGGGPVPAFTGTMNKDISASAEIWNFFKRHSLPATASLLDLRLEHDGMERKYLLHIPAAYDGSEAWPLVLNLHGLGVNRFGQMLESQMNPVADTAQFIVAYPEGTLRNVPNIGEAPGWNTFMDPNAPNDIAFIDRLLEHIVAAYNIDTSRIYATGKSQGGEMSYLLACQIPEKIAAIASVSGTITVENMNSTCTPNQPIPVLHIHGTADLLGPFNGGAGILGPFPTFPAVTDHLAAWMDNNGCTLDATSTSLPDTDTSDSSSVTLFKYESCQIISLGDNMERTAEVWLYQVNGGGHTWPGGPKEQIPPGFEAFFGNINRDINASSEIWNFFNRRQLVTSTPPIPLRTLNLIAFPNPALNELNFSFELQRTAPVELSLYNSIGQKIETIFNQTLGQGKQQIRWDRTHRTLTPGVYYCRLSINNQVTSQAIVLN